MPFAYETTDTPTGRKRAQKEKDATLPNFTHPLHDAMADTWRDLRVLAAGTRAVWGNASRFMMQHPREEDETFRRRARMAAVYNGYRRVIKASTGMVMSRPVKLGDNASAKFRAAVENIDGQGNHLDVFTRRLLTDGLTIGVGGILVDWAVVSAADELSDADEQTLGLRAYWVHVLGENVLNWRFAKINGATILTMLVLKEVREEEDDSFGVAEATYYRVFRRPVLLSSTDVGIITKSASDVVTWELWKWDAQAEKPAPHSGPFPLRGAKRIPFSPFVNGDSPGTLESEPPLQDLADMNINHYQVSTDRAWVMHLACVPVPVRKGHRPQHNAAGDLVEQMIGPTALMDVSENGDFFWRSPDGTAFEPTGKELEAIERRMGALGLAFLFPENKAQETAAAKRIDRVAENATLGSIVRALRDCLEGAALIHAEYEREEPTTLAPNTDFEEQMMDQGLAKLLSEMEAQGQLTITTLLETLKAGKLLSDDFDVEDEVEELAQRAKAMAGEMLPAAEVPDGDPESPYAAGPDDVDDPRPVRPAGRPAARPATRPAAAVAPRARPAPAEPDVAPAIPSAQLEGITTNLGAVSQQLQALASLVETLAAKVATPAPAPALDVNQIALLVAAIAAAMKSPPPAFALTTLADGTKTIAPIAPPSPAST